MSTHNRNKGPHKHPRGPRGEGPRGPRPHGGRRRHAPRPQVEVKGRSDGYWIYGWHSVAAALANPQRIARRVWVTAGARQKLEEKPALLKRAEEFGLEVVTGEMFSRALSDDAVHQGIAMEVPPLNDSNIELILKSEARGPVVLLDQVTDPHNVGAILRSAAAFDSRGIIMTLRHGPRDSGVLARSAAGALEIVPLVRVSNLVQAMLALKSSGFWCVGLDVEAPQALHEADLAEKVALVMGAEGKGLRRLTAEHCDLMVKLPMSGRMESLNVSNAAAVALYEIFKKRS